MSKETVGTVEDFELIKEVDEKGNEKVTVVKIKPAKKAKKENITQNENE